VAVGGFYSENDSVGGVGVGRFHLAEDRWRVLAAGGSARIEYDFYGIGTAAGEAGDSVELRTTYGGGEVEALGRVAPKLWLGPAALAYDVSTRAADPSQLPAGQPADTFDGLNAGLGLHLERDTRDRTLAPTAGTLLRVTGDFYSESLGGDFGFQSYSAQLAGYPSLDEQSVLAWRLHGKLVAGDAPFYALAQYDARGYQKGRYRDELELGAELEYRRHLGGRFGAVAFAGLGQVAPSLGDLNGSDWLPSGGVGLRFQLTEASPLNYALDVAAGRDETILYLSVGDSF
jgi:hypothetical protein